MHIEDATAFIVDFIARPRAAAAYSDYGYDLRAECCCSLSNSRLSLVDEISPHSARRTLEPDLVDGFLQHGEWIARAVLVPVFPGRLFLFAARPAAYGFAHVFGHASGA